MVTHGGRQTEVSLAVNMRVVHHQTYSTRALFVLVSSANAWPICFAFSGFHVAAEHTAAGKHAARVPPVNTSPRAPFGPSLVYCASVTVK
jgi:hypothetical protein